MTKYNAATMVLHFQLLTTVRLGFSDGVVQWSSAELEDRGQNVSKHCRAASLTLTALVVVVK